MRRLILTYTLLFSVCLINFAQEQRTPVPTQLMGHRFLTFNTIVRVNQIEVGRDRNEGFDERDLNTPERMITFRENIEKAFPGARITWGFTWQALHDTSANYTKMRQLVVEYHHKFGDELTFAPGGYFANAYNTIEQINKDLHDALNRITEIVGNGYRPKSIIAGFLSSKNQQYLAEKEGIHVCQGNIWSQYDVDNQDGEGAISYPYYPSKEHFCKPAQGKADFIDCVNLDGWTMDFVAAATTYNSRMGVGPLETFRQFGRADGVMEILHTVESHFEDGFELNGFAWVTNCWELGLPVDLYYINDWFREIRRYWPDAKVITQGEFGMLWREHYKDNSFDYRFVSRGSGVGGSDSKTEIRWFMNKNFRLALSRNWQKDKPEKVIDFTRYDLKAEEPKGMTRRWSLMGEINQKRNRPQDYPRLLNELSAENQRIIKSVYPSLFSPGTSNSR